MPFVFQSTTLQDQGNSWVVIAPASASPAEAEHVKVSFFGTIGSRGRLPQVERRR